MEKARQNTLWTYLLFTVFVTPAASAAGGDLNVIRHEPVAESHIPVTCGDGFQGNNFELAMDTIGLSLKQLKVQLPGWRVIVVPASQWSVVSAAFGAKSVPAFSNLLTQSTYLSSGLLFPQAGMDAQLRELTPLTGVSRLRWVLAHEYGHLACNTHDEKKAERAAGHLLYGKASVCD